MKLVMKFGGSAVRDGDALRNAAGIVKEFHDEGHEITVVVSAMRGVTNSLQDCAKMAAEAGSADKVIESTSELRSKHHTAAEHAILDERQSLRLSRRIGDSARSDENCLDEALFTIANLVDQLERVLIGICHVGELTDRSLDYVMSFGERLSAPILSGSVRSLGVESCSVEGGDAGIITNDTYRNARPTEEAYELIPKRLGLILNKGFVPVVTGYIGVNEKGIITTLGRGGSDYTATILGAALKVDEIWLWKETDGIMSTNPDFVPEAQIIPEISYIEAMEMSFFGAEVLHPLAMEPAIRRGIPVRVRNFLKPEGEGTLITDVQSTVEGGVKGISLIDNVSLLNISGAAMVGTPGSAAHIFSALAEKNVNIMMISQGSSERNISMVVDQPHIEGAVEALETGFNGNTTRDITFRNDICVIAVVGSGMAGVPGVAGRVFSALGKNHVNVIMISQGSSECNISFVVSSEDAPRAVKLLHDEFVGKA